MPLRVSYLSWPPDRCLICNKVTDSESGGYWSTVHGSYVHAFQLCETCNKEFADLYPIPKEDQSLPWEELPAFNWNYGDSFHDMIQFLKGKGKLADWLVPEGYKE